MLKYRGEITVKENRCSKEQIFALIGEIALLMIGMQKNVMMILGKACGIELAREALSLMTSLCFSFAIFYCEVFLLLYFIEVLWDLRDV